jgi:hypothetical protein
MNKKLILADIAIIAILAVTLIGLVRQNLNYKEKISKYESDIKS